MTSLNGDQMDVGELLSDTERGEFYKAVREGAMEAQASAGLVMAEGTNPYADDWNVDFSWPSTAGFQRGEDWVEDSLDADIAQATLVVGKPDKRKGREGQLRASTLKRVKLNGSDMVKLRDQIEWGKMREDWGGSPDPFAYGSSDITTGGVLGQYLPLWPGPVTRQLYWQEYWMMSAKAFEAYNHDPISWRCVHMKAEFALGRGLELKVTKSKGTGKGQTHDNAKDVFDEYWKRNKMDERLDTVVRDYCWGGELFMRYFKKGRKLTLRSLDPASIYDLITDPEDIETVFAYHQQFQTAYQLYPPTSGTPPTGVAAPTGSSTPGANVRYIIRQILPQEVDHYKSNSSAFERRGRSDLFPALGWIKRLRDYLTSHVIRSDMLARICWDLEVAGNQSTITSLRSQLFPNGQPPQPGTVFAHNTASKLQALVPETTSSSSGRADPILDALVTMTSLSAGLPKDWLGFGLQNTRAGALVATEPGSKALEDVQKTVETIIHDGFDRAMATALIADAELEITFPSIASEDRKQKLDDLGTMEGNGWISKRTAATMAAKEIGITTYDFETEQDTIAREFPETETEDKSPKILGPDGTPLQKPKQGDGKVRRSVILATKRQAPKLDITKSPPDEDEPPGLLVPTDGSAVPGTAPAPGSPNGTGKTVMGGGSHPTSDNPLSPDGAADIKKEHTNIREGEDIFELTASQLNFLLMRERQGARRRPDDPEFDAAAQRYRSETADNLQELVDSAREPKP